MFHSDLWWDQKTEIVFCRLTENLMNSLETTERKWSRMFEIEWISRSPPSFSFSMCAALGNYPTIRTAIDKNIIREPLRLPHVCVYTEKGQNHRRSTRQFGRRDEIVHHGHRDFRYYCQGMASRAFGGDLMLGSLNFVWVRPWRVLGRSRGYLMKLEHYGAPHSS